MWFLLGEVAGQAEVGDSDVAVFIQQDISWLREDTQDRVRLTDSATDQIRARDTPSETSLIHKLSYNILWPSAVEPPVLVIFCSPSFYLLCLLKP